MSRIEWRAAPGWFSLAPLAMHRSEGEFHSQLRGARWSDDVDGLAEIRLIDGVEIVLSVVRMIGEVEHLEQTFQTGAVRDLSQAHSLQQSNVPTHGRGAAITTTLPNAIAIRNVLDPRPAG